VSFFNVVLQGDQNMEESSGLRVLRCILPYFENVYARYNRREFVSPDPLETIYPFLRIEDREVAALLVSCIAYGRVAMILRNARRLLGVLGHSPAEYVRNASPSVVERETSFFRHRFTTGSEIASLICGMGSILREYGTLEELFAYSMGKNKNFLEGVSIFVEKIRKRSPAGNSFLLPSPRDGSACKRLFLFLKWMVRRDDVDPGGWKAAHPRDLLLPMDVHMFRICSSLGFTDRKHPDLRTSVEVTGLFRMLLPEDPTKYDFVLTRFGIRKDLSENSFLEFCQEKTNTKK